jgi:V/A-type H+-transporting ATPase subunit F
MDYFFIGEAELLTAFRFVGVGGKAVASQEEAFAAFRTLTGGVKTAAGPGAGQRASAPAAKILILTEQAVDWLGEELTEWQLSGKYPLVVELPGLTGRVAGRKTLVDSIREAIGIHV